MNAPFVWGVVVGVVGTWAFHKWVKPMATSKGNQ